MRSSIVPGTSAGIPRDKFLRVNLRRIICVVLTGFVAACGPDSASIATDVLSPTRSVLLFTIDTLRADHLSAYGYEKHSTPATDQFARQSLVFERAYS